LSPSDEGKAGYVGKVPAFGQELETAQKPADHTFGNERSYDKA